MTEPQRVDARWLPYSRPSAHDLATDPPVLAHGRRARFIGRCTCGWQTGRRRSYGIAWEGLLRHVADARMEEVFGGSHGIK